MNSMPLISIIIPVYNVEKFLSQCLDSVLAQTYTNLQIILIDDGSADNSGKICDAYANKDPRVTVIHQSNQGVSAARNAGLKIANGEYIGFVDSDDYISMDMYEYLYNLIQQYHVPISLCNFFKLIEGIPQENPSAATNGTILTTDQALTKLIRQLFMWNKLFDRRLLEKNLTFPTAISYGEDMLVLLEAFKHAQQIVYGNKTCYYYRQHLKSTTCNKKWNPKNLTWIISTNKILNYAREKNLKTLTDDLQFSQMNLAASFLRDCIINCPIDHKSIKELRIYFSKCVIAFLCSKVKFSKKAFVLCSFINLNLAKALYNLTNKKEL